MVAAVVTEDQGPEPEKEVESSYLPPGSGSVGLAASSTVQNSITTGRVTMAPPGGNCEFEQ